MAPQIEKNYITNDENTTDDLKATVVNTMATMEFQKKYFKRWNSVLRWKVTTLCKKTER